MSLLTLNDFESPNKLSPMFRIESIDLVSRKAA
jgi:hypothetical protein